MGFCSVAVLKSAMEEGGGGVWVLKMLNPWFKQHNLLSVAFEGDTRIPSMVVQEPISPMGGLPDACYLPVGEGDVCGGVGGWVWKLIWGGRSWGKKVCAKPFGM